MIDLEDLGEDELHGWTIDTLTSNKARGLGRPAEIDRAIWDAIEVPIVLSHAERIKQQFLDKIQDGSVVPDDHKAAVTSLMPLALHGLVDVVTSPRSKDSVRLDGFKYIIDHSIGKAKQEIEHSGSLALEIRRQAKEYMERFGTTDIIEVDPIRDEIEALAKRYELENFKVGDKGEG